MGTGSLNGKTGEMLRWVVTLALGALTAYFTAQGAIKDDVAKVKTTVAVVETNEANHYAELLRRIDAKDREDREFRNEIRAIVDAAARGVDRRTNEPVLLQRSIEQGR
jgi:demethoxyubiquinone hydroxylase (CLK1/Coq7/Cat5 family)